jgi:hypothetical protein
MGVSIKKKLQNEKAKMGRPLVEIDKDQFERMCQIHCTLNEIAGVFMCSKDTIERWTKKTYGRTFADVREDLSSIGKMSLRREMFKKALGGNGSMMIWLSKQHLGMKDRIETGLDDNAQEMVKLAYSLPTGDEE